MTPELPYLLSVLAIVFIIDFSVRAIPFAIVKPLRESQFFAHMGAWMPAGILLILAIVSFHDSYVTVPSHGWAAAVAAVVTILSHLLSGRRMMVSIGAGTACYVLLLNLM